MTCTYCNAAATTVDHVPIRSLFAPPRPSTLITVPSCKGCNNGAHLDDQYFRDMVLWYHPVSDLPQAQQQIASMVARATGERSKGYLSMLHGKLRKVVVRLANGQVFVAPAMAIDAARISRVAQRFVRGLFRHVNNRRLALDAEITVQTDPDVVRSRQEEIERLLRGPNLRTIQDGVFWFTHNTTADNALVSVWLLVFFDQYAILALVREP